MDTKPIPSLLIRTDASEEIGAGHLSRCLALATELRTHFADIRFLGHIPAMKLADLVKKSGFGLRTLTSPLASVIDDADAVIAYCAESDFQPDVVLTDHYDITAEWHDAIVEGLGAKIAVIDDLADRQQRCDLLIDQNFYLEQDRYAGLVPPEAVLLLGPRYAMLRPEFSQPSAAYEGLTKDIDVLVSFGGADQKQHTIRTIKALSQLVPSPAACIVVGAMTPGQDRIMELCNSAGFELHIQTSEMARLMHRSRAAFVACSSTVWELAMMGVPTIITESEPFQATLANDLEQAKLILRLSPIDDLNDSQLSEVLGEALAQTSTLEENASRIRQLMTGSDVYGARAVATQIAGLCARHGHA
ncbi:UDP-2,4-diacetamido-2,4,6-trideoxy-beta-L-altropyranose hydrolase [Pontivivens insulae]|uniref:UDP-2,4-diacetamido-2,4, 6-trideoxy-beta-L-altropyranose hydrolase n=1 Tax=Pontivivens insulae TaxID=1639689 RepID=A0A2R8A7G6_9RHOB|nr:UDP-2,4-diacetamido-2,4,6-trideoxy-beta-L-altropyranose hydrolase [Pontivivens insulae]RED18286.1 UDP-2,4-diacetamido-2,4,6-trideoxy-beta-L-altropyranose hydrolase [Pontivivens insulae]SPF28184.1 UDP-2,4-diacetamido-2,4, 6-trideoxy-beta-L-altropyranose hydrolase [Pontivivens insulae]